MISILYDVKQVLSSDVTLVCKPVYVRVGRSVELTATLNKETTWKRVTWRMENKILGTCSSSDCKKEGPLFKHRTERLTDTGVFYYTVVVANQGSTVSCSDKVVVYGR